MTKLKPGKFVMETNDFRRHYGSPCYEAIEIFEVRQGGENLLWWKFIGDSKCQPCGADIFAPGVIVGEIDPKQED